MRLHEEDDSIHLHQALGTVIKLQDNLQSAHDTIAALQGDMKSAQDTLQSVTRTGRPLIFKLTEYQKKKENNETHHPFTPVLRDTTCVL